MESKHSLEQLEENRKQLFKMELSVEKFKKLREASIDYDVPSMTEISSGG
jgi:serine/threonine protein kinase